MAKEVAGLIKLQIKGGAANPSPPVGPALGSKGINIMEFCKQFNARTQDKAGKILPVIITYYADKSFDFVIKTPPVAIQLLEVTHQKVSTLTNALLFSSASESAAVFVAEALHLVKRDLRLIFKNAELADAVIDVNHRVAHRIDRHPPHIVIPAVGAIDNAAAVRLDDSVIFESGASRYHMRLIALRKLHGNAEWNQTELPRFQCHFLRRPKIDPVRLSVNIGQTFNRIRKIFNPDLWHVCSSCYVCLFLSMLPTPGHYALHAGRASSVPALLLLQAYPQKAHG